MSNDRGGAETMLADAATADWTSLYDIPPSIVANSSPHRNNHEAALASRAKALGSAISPRLCFRSVGVSKTMGAPSHPYCRRSQPALELGDPARARRAHTCAGDAESLQHCAAPAEAPGAMVRQPGELLRLLQR